MLFMVFNLEKLSILDFNQILNTKQTIQQRAVTTRLKMIRK